MKVTIDKTKKTITIVIPLEKAHASKSGKSMVIASTNGNKPAGVEYDGKPVTIGLNMYYKA